MYKLGRWSAFSVPALSLAQSKSCGGFRLLCSSRSEYEQVASFAGADSRLLLTRNCPTIALSRLRTQGNNHQSSQRCECPSQFACAIFLQKNTSAAISETYTCSSWTNHVGRFDCIVKHSIVNLPACKIILTRSISILSTWPQHLIEASDTAVDGEHLDFHQ